MQGRYKVITLCGSTRFKNEFIEAQKRLTLQGCIVITVGLFGHSGDGEVWDGMKRGLKQSISLLPSQIAKHQESAVYQRSWCLQ